MCKRGKIFFSILMVCIMGLTLLSGCLPTSGGNTDTSPKSTPQASQSTPQASATATATAQPAAEKQTVRMWTFLDPTKTDGRSVALKQMIETFESQNNNVKIAVEPQDWQAMTPKFFAAHSAGNAPDVIWVLQDEMGGALKLNALEPFENLFLKNWKKEDIADIDDAFWSFGSRDGKHYQVSLSRNYIALYYRADLFEANKIELPKTWDEFIAAAKKLTGKDEKTGMMRYGFGQAFNVDKVDAQVMTNHLLAAQGTLFTNDGKANWSNKAAQDALQFQIDCIKKYGITPESAIATTGEELFVDFCAGKYAMITGGAVRVPKNKADATFDPDAVQIMLFPGVDAKTPSPAVVTGWSVGVWSGSKVKEAAGKFVEAMISPESDSLWLKLGGQVPVRKSTIEREKEFLNNPKNKFITVMSETFATCGWAQPTEFTVSGWKNDLNQAMQNVLVEGKSLEDALKASEKLFNDRNSK